MQKNIRLFVVVVLATVLCSLPAEGKHTKLRSLSAGEVYSILREAGREDVIPEGRFITHGIEADKEPPFEPEPEQDLTETGRLLVSAAALNATTTLLAYMQHLNYTALLTAFIPTYNFTITKPTLNLTSLSTFNFTALSSVPILNLTTLTTNKGVNLTALTALKPGLNFTTLSLGLITTRSAPKTVQKEICFSSRSLNDIYDDEIETESEDDGIKSTDSNTGNIPIFETGYETTSSPTSWSTARSISSPDDISSISDSPTAVSSTGSGIGSGSATGTAPYERLGSSTINCVVVRRPQNVRRRQSSQNIRRPQANRGPQNVRKPQIVQKPQKIRRPQNVQRLQIIQRPQTVQRLQNVRRKQNVRRPQNVPRPQNIGKPQNVRKPQNTRRPQNFGRGRFASN